MTQYLAMFADGSHFMAESQDVYDFLLNIWHEFFNNSISTSAEIFKKMCHSNSDFSIEECVQYFNFHLYSQSEVLLNIYKIKKKVF